MAEDNLKGLVVQGSEEMVHIKLETLRQEQPTLVLVVEELQDSGVRPLEAQVKLLFLFLIICWGQL